MCRPPAAFPSKARVCPRGAGCARRGSAAGLRTSGGCGEPHTYWPSLPGPPGPVRVTAVVPVTAAWGSPGFPPGSLLVSRARRGRTDDNHHHRRSALPAATKSARRGKRGAAGTGQASHARYAGWNRLRRCNGGYSATSATRLDIRYPFAGRSVAVRWGTATTESHTPKHRSGAPRRQSSNAVIGTQCVQFKRVRRILCAGEFAFRARMRCRPLARNRSRGVENFWKL